MATAALEKIQENEEMFLPESNKERGNEDLLQTYPGCNAGKTILFSKAIFIKISTKCI